MSLPERVAAAMDDSCSGWRAESGVVAVSGGADSVALLCVMNQLPREKKLVAVHLNHMLRGEESDADEAFVIHLCHRLGVEVRTERINMAAEAKGKNLEATARECRYEWFEMATCDLEESWLATAHTMDDQAETVLHRLIRGTGIAGLRGIAASSQLGGKMALLRPLLGIRREELREYLRSINQPFREDTSNLDVRFTRNRIRHELLPVLETFNPRIVESLGQLSQQAEELYDFTNWEFHQCLMEAELPRAGGTLVFDAELLENYTSRERRGLLRLAWQRERWPLLGMSFSHWVRLAELGTHDFPGGVRSERRGRVFQLQGDSRRPAF